MAVLSGLEPVPSSQFTEEHLGEPMNLSSPCAFARLPGVVPEAEQGIAYNMPVFGLNGKVIAGFAAFKNHLSILPPQRVRLSRAVRRTRRLHHLHRRAQVPAVPVNPFETQSVKNHCVVVATPSG
ncbi:MAG: DUF1801 domain-containing protein [Nitrospiraceae bacterium]|nr:DUF1801 domain-containing protein [Nitrospiraceae bacterium]